MSDSLTFKRSVAAEGRHGPAMPHTRYHCRVLVVDDEPAILAMLAHQLGGEFDVLTACSLEQARAVVLRDGADIVLTDLQLDDGSGLGLLEWVRQVSPRTARVLLSGTTRVEDAADAVNKALVHRLLLKPWRAQDLIDNIRGVAKTLLLERSHEQLLDDYRRLTVELEDRVAARTQEAAQAVLQLELKNQFLEKMALTDPLTGLANRRAVELIARKELLRRTRMPSPIAIGLIDADHFKNVNSDYTLTGGDQVLVWLSRTLQASVRGTDSVGRIGGEEFMVVAPHTDANGAEIVAERLRQAVEQNPPLYQGQRIHLTISLGFAVAEAGQVVGYEALREQAAGCLATAKAGGRNRAVVESYAAMEKVPGGTTVNLST